MEQVAGESYSTPRFALFLVALFAGLALALAATGMYGVISYAVSQRMHEFGMRMALGARRWDVMRLVLGQGVRMAAIGVVAGLLGGAALAQFLGTLLIRGQASGSGDVRVGGWPLAIASGGAGVLRPRAGGRRRPIHDGAAETSDAVDDPAKLAAAYLL